MIRILIVISTLIILSNGSSPLSRFTKEPVRQRCSPDHRLALSKGFYDDNSVEGCAVECLHKSRLCMSFGYDTRASSTSKCSLYYESCEPRGEFKTTNLNADTDFYLANYNALWPRHLPARLREVFDYGHWNFLDSNSMFPNGKICSAKQPDWDLAGYPAQKSATAHMVCDINTPGDGIIEQSTVEYAYTKFDINICAAMCFYHNSLNISTTCKGFNLKLNPTTNMFTCDLLNCNIFDPHVVFASSTIEGETFGFLDTYLTPKCLGPAIMFNEEVNLYRDFIPEYRSECVGNRIDTVVRSSAVSCANHCRNTNDCVGFVLTNRRECKIFRRCNTFAEASRGLFYWSRLNYTSVGYLPSGAPYELLLEQKRLSSCRRNPSNDLIATYSDIEYDPISCENKCLNEQNECVAFEINSHLRCFTFSQCNNPVLYPLSNGNEEVFVYYNDTDDDDDEFTPYPVPVIQPVANVCNGPDWCTPDEPFCSYDGICVDQDCSSHDDCYIAGVRGYTPMCDLRTNKCVNAGTSTCRTRKECRNSAHREYKYLKRLGSAASKVTVGADQVGDFSNNLMTGALNIINSTKLVYTSLIGRENIEINGLPDTITQKAIDEAIRQIRCGSLSSECEFTAPQFRRSLQSTYSITLFYDIDSTVFQDLIDSGVSFTDANFITILANVLEVDPATLTVTANDGDIGIEVSMVNGNTTRTPETIEEVRFIQSQLSNLTTTLASTFNISAGDIILTDIDLCGSSPCNDRGTCNATTGLCTCEDDWIGLDCQSPPTSAPTTTPTRSPSTSPTKTPSSSPTHSPTGLPTTSPTRSPTGQPTGSPTGSSTNAPTLQPTVSPTIDDVCGQCQNGGSCVNDKCKCVYPFFGVICESSNDPCTQCI